MKKPDNEAAFWKSQATILFVLGALCALYDIWYVATGKHTGRLPFLWSTFFLICGVALRRFGHWNTLASPAQRELARAALDADTIGNPDHPAARDRIEHPPVIG